MLKTLTIQNFVLIDHLELNFETGFTSITGETGAGKSILLGALALLMGQRGDISLIRPSCDKCIIEAYFTVIDEAIRNLLMQEDIDCDEEGLLIRRELSTKGKSRAFVNDSPASITLLKRLSEYLIDIHSQHKNLLLGDAQFQLSVLDLYSNNKSTLESYRETYKRHQNLQKELSEAKRMAIEAAKEQDYLQYQYFQLEEANLRAGELERLESEERELSHASDIQSALSYAYSALDGDEGGAISALSSALSALRGVERYWQTSGDLQERLDSVRVELRDIAYTLSRAEEDIEYNPERLSYISNRLDLLNTLLTKHRVQTIEELITLRDELDQRLNLIGNADERIAGLESALESLTLQIETQAEELYKKRKKAADNIEKALVSALRDLGMPYVQFHIDIQHGTQYNSNGADAVTYLFSANKEMKPEAVAEIASGGEISRLMLCLKSLIADQRHLPTIIFDEIDTGVSGDIADKIGGILQDMGQNMQVMAVTHLPQIAAAGIRHLHVYKEHGSSSTISHIHYISGQERVEEIARMQSGSKLSAVTLAAAQELLNNVQNKTDK